MLNDVCKKDCIDAIEYLWEEGFVDEMTSDKKYYTTILLKKVANIYKIKLGKIKLDNEDNTVHPLGALEEVDKWKVE
tara:strand:- start:582 stop:812 length:231 start_codon:yes stop_codon:yes gene_type:complete